MQPKKANGNTGGGAPVDTAEAEVLPLVSDPGAKPASSARRSEWYHSAFIIMAEVMGMGLLGLPHAMAQLGWVIGVSSCVLFGVLSIYSMLLLSRTQNEIFPDAQSYAEMARLTFGPTFAVVTRVIVLTSWALILVYFLLACAESVNIALPNLPLSISQLVPLVGVVLLVPLQFRSLYQVAWLSLASSIAVVLAVVFIVVALSQEDYDDAHLGNGSVPHTHRHSVWPTGGGVIDLFGHMASFIFAYMGHSVVFEIMREMRDPNDFSRAALSSNTFMICVYVGTSTLGYAAYGADVAGYLPDSMRAGPAKRVVGALLTLHTAVAYMVVAQPLHRAYHGFFLSETLDKPSSMQHPKAALHWLLICTCQMVFSAVFAIVVPFFADLQGLIGSLTGALIMFGYPALFFLRAHQLHGAPVGWADTLLCSLFLYIFTPAFLVLGTMSSVKQIVLDWEAADGQW
ncbi:amino acid transporter [bacterium]|nr:amino acid transporter [bacterium]